AERYRTAKTEQDAQSRFDKTGLRWTEFLRLPYFDLPTMLIIDSMHNLFLGLLKEHFRYILGPRSTKTGKKRADPDTVLDIIITPSPDNPRPTKPTEITSLEKAIKALSGPMSDRLKIPSERLDISRSGVWKGLHVNSARMSQTEKVQDSGPPPAVELITAEEKEALWADLANIVKPSWMTSVPPQVGGESSDGKLKSDQWRTLGTVYMPITLIRLWSTSEDPQRRELLDLTMDLVSAVILASSRVTSRANSEQCLAFLLSYRTKLKNLFPQYRCHPNHHMALHIPEFLLLFGPVHGWWTFPFERMIGKLQRVPTNYKPGEIKAMCKFDGSPYLVEFRGIRSNHWTQVSSNVQPQDDVWCPELSEASQVAYAHPRQTTPSPIPQHLLGR
ncbi:hypothetical protein B0H11DRAFT_1720508, partial [Mycena galericulata]